MKEDKENITEEIKQTDNISLSVVDLRVSPPFYEDEYCQIYNEDCLMIMPALRPLRNLAIIITDPPYGIGAYANGTMGGGVLAKQSTFEKTDWDNTKLDDVYFYMMKYVSREQIIFGGNYYGDVLGSAKGWVVWDKDNGENNFADCELAWTSFDKAVRKIKHKWQGMLQQNMKEKELKFHPTQKPLPVMQWILENYSTQADIIIDPFMGSGTTLVAAKTLGRKAIGIEKDKNYCEIAVKRLQATQQRLIFGEAG